MNIRTKTRSLSFWAVLPLGFLLLLTLWNQPALAEVTFLNAWGSPGSGDGQFSAATAVAVAPSGQVYVVDLNLRRIQRFDAVGNYETQWGSLGSGNGEFDDPYDVAVGPTGQVYVTESGNDRVQRFDADGNYQTQWGGLGTGNGEFSNPRGIAVTSSGQVYVTDAANDRIQRFDADGNYETKWGSMGFGNGQFDNPISVAVAPSGQIYVSDSLNERIQRFDADGNYETKWGSLGTGNGQFDFPRGVSVSATGQVYVVDYYNDRIQTFDAAGDYQDQWGSTGTGNGQFNLPQDVAVAATGLIYVVDSNNQRIQRFFDADLWVSGTNTFVDGAAGPTSVAIGLGEILGTSLTLDASKGLAVGNTTTIQAGGTLTLDGGTFSTETLDLSGGIFAFNSGTLALGSITSPPMIVEPNGVLGDYVLIDGSKVLQPVNLIVGETNTGSLGITEGGTVTVAINMSIGNDAAVDGSATVAGIGSSLASGNYMDVGQNGNASLYITDGGVASARHATIAAFSGAGSATVSGVGSRWTMTETLSVAGDPLSGPGGTGVLNISDDGFVTAATQVVIHPDGEIRLARDGRIGGGTLTNNGLLSGDGRVDNVLNNTSGGEVMVTSGDQLTFTGAANTNAGLFTLLGGATIFDQDLTNQTNAIIFGNGTLRADGGITNDGKYGPQLHGQCDRRCH